jgi:ATP-dependent Clp protease ATP-binding subunit ClpB
MEAVSTHFRPEFINRIDEIVVFHGLDNKQIRTIANIQIKRLQKRLMERDLQLEVSNAALDYLAEVGFDPIYGARPLKRAIQQYLENPLAQDILQGKFAPKDKIFVDRDEKNGLKFSIYTA